MKFRIGKIVLIAIASSVLSLRSVSGAESAGESVQPPPPPQGAFPKMPPPGDPGMPGHPGERPRPPFGFHAQRRGKAIQDALEKLKKENPEKFNQLEELKKTNREAYFEELRKLVPRRNAMPNQVAELDRKCFELSRQYRQARTEEEKAAIKKELLATLTKSTDALIANLKERLEEMQKQINNLETDREAIIQKRLEMLLELPLPPPPKHDK